MKTRDYRLNYHDTKRHMQVTRIVRATSVATAKAQAPKEAKKTTAQPLNGR